MLQNICFSFKPFDNIKIILSLWATQKQVAVQIWLLGHNLPTTASTSGDLYSKGGWGGSEINKKISEQVK